ncbi:discoidin domain-containing protein [Paenibacillus sp. SAF-068]|uniref:discoidin domain-containing protein n=1 Tax=Paenibacillus sp. SAF-068 TaxID=3436864 RepID=UPI003F818799
MSVPATTGQLRENIGDMEIGDYIACSAIRLATINASTAFYDLGYPNSNEVPLTGFDATTQQTGVFYLVKVNKGILVADRVVFNMVSWDALNTRGLIEGFADWNPFVLTPKMTSNIAPYGEASASSEVSATKQAYQAFDQLYSGNKFWQASQETGWIQYRFPEGKRVSKYSLTGIDIGQFSLQINPKDWTFEGSNDGSNWTLLDTRVGESFTTLQKKKYTFSNTQKFTHYRLNITKNNGLNNYVAITELELMDNIVGTFRSLTGGISFADESRNLSKTNKGYGAWPTINEWDTYIANFPVNKIKTGKILDDIFHFSTIYTLAKETNLNAPNTWRTVRGYTTSDFISITTSSTSHVNYGFRPVYEYKEV